MQDNIHPLIQHTPTDSGNVSVPALKVLSEITTSLSTDANVEQLLGRFLSTMIRLAGAQAGAVRVITDDRTHLRLIGSVGLPPELVEHEAIVSVDCGVCGKAAREVTVSSWNNVAFCKRQANDAYFSDTCNTVVAVPLMHKNQVMGVYNLFLEEGKTVPEDVRLLFRSISEHLGIALENARLTRENMRISLMNERQMLANQIHDSLAQTLAYAKMRLTVLSDAMRHEDYPKANRYLGDVEEAVDLAYADLRDLITQYRDRINPRGLVPAIQEMAKSFRKKANADVDFLNLVQDVSLTPDEEIRSSTSSRNRSTTSQSTPARATSSSPSTSKTASTSSTSPTTASACCGRTTNRRPWARASASPSCASAPPSSTASSASSRAPPAAP